MPTPLTELDCGLARRHRGDAGGALGRRWASGWAPARARRAEEQAGLSHLLEHLLFRGSERFSSRGDRPDLRRDGRGAERRDGQGDDVDLLACPGSPPAPGVRGDGDMMWRPAFEDADTERRVVLEEIAMYEDEPQDKVFDVLGRGGVRRPPAGARRSSAAPRWSATRRWRRSAASTPTATCRPTRWWRRRGRSTTTKWWRWCATAFPPMRAESRSRPTSLMPTTCRPACASSARTPSSTTSAWARPGIARDDDRRFALRVLDNVLGGTPRSRLFQEVRERRGLAYSRVLVLQPVRRHRPGGHLPGYAGATTLGPALAGGGRRAGAPARRAGERRRAGARARRTSRAGWCCRWSRPARA